MNTIDLAVYSLLAIVAGFPALRNAAGKAVAYARSATSPDSDAAPDSWAKQRVAQLIGLIEELEAKGDEATAALCRKVVWSLIGGDDKPQGQKK